MVRHFRKTAPIEVRIEEGLSKQLGVEVVEVSSNEENSEEEVVEVSSGEENSEEENSEKEVTIVQEKSIAGPVEGSSSDSSGRIILARAQVFLHFIDFILDSSSDEETSVLKPQVEESRGLDIIENRARGEDLNTTSDEASDEKIVGGNAKVSKKKTMTDIKNSKITKVKKPKQVLNKKRSTVNPFTPEEDKILLEAMSSGEELNFTKLAKKMNRDRTSVKHRVDKLKLSGGVSTKTSPRYNLQEDLKIIDSAVENLKIFVKLDDTPLKDAKDLAESFRRKTESVGERWEVILKIWLKSYYTKTLNLNIKVMLANVVADNFENIDSIDWNFVKSFKEFSGHTLVSIRNTFFKNIYETAKRHSKDDKTKLTLKEIAEDAAVTYCQENARKIPVSILKRQTEVIEYFEKKVNELGIKDFL